jgi:hypothetical protein
LSISREFFAAPGDAMGSRSVADGTGTDRRDA